MPISKHAQRLIAASIFATASVCAFAATAQASLVATWLADGNANDAVGGNNGTLQNGTSFGPGVSGQAFYFDGVNDAISVTKQPNLNMNGGDFTISAWVRFTADIFPDAGVLFFNYAGSPYYLLAIDAAERASFTMRDNASNTVQTTGTTALNDGEWHNIAATRTGTTGSIYVDGLLQSTSSNPSLGVIDTSGSTFARIGWAASGGDSYTQLNANPDDNFFSGAIDEIRVYDTALSSEEIQALAAIPEPVSLGLFSLGLAGLATARRRGRASNARTK